MGTKTHDYDFFLSYASEDREVSARLADLLQSYGVTVWFDQFELRIGDSLRAAIDRGLAASRYGVVILSDSFFRKDWTQRELDGLIAKSESIEKRLFPVWHEIERVEVAAYSPILAALVGAPTADGLDKVATRLLDAAEHSAGLPIARYNATASREFILRYHDRYAEPLCPRCDAVRRPVILDHDESFVGVSSDGDWNFWTCSVCGWLARDHELWLYYSGAPRDQWDSKARTSPEDEV